MVLSEYETYLSKASRFCQSLKLPPISNVQTETRPQRLEYTNII